MNQTSTSRGDHLIEYYLPFFLLLSQYKFGPVNLGEIGLFLLVVIRLVNDRGRLIYRGRKEITILVCYVVIRMLMNGIIHVDELSAAVNSSIEYLVVSFSVVFITDDVDFDEGRLYKIWKIAGIIYFAGIVYQLVMLYVLGNNISPISLFPGQMLRSEETSIRPSSFFAEPASFVCAVLPLEFLALKRKEYIWALIVSIMIVASTSTVGIVLTIVLWSLSFFQKKQNLYSRVIYLIVVVVLIWAVVRYDIFSAGLNKFIGAINGENTVGSRIICGLDTIRTMNVFEWIFGTTYNDSTSYLLQHWDMIPKNSPIFTYMIAHGHIFLNTFCQIIFQYGLIGMLLYCNAIFLKRLKKGYEANMYLIMKAISIFGQSKFMNAIFFMELMLLLLYDRKKELDEHENWRGNDSIRE